MTKPKRITPSRANTLGFVFIVFSLSLACLSYCLDRNGFQFGDQEFSWFSASGAVMVASSIVFERTMPGVSPSGGLDIASLPSTSDELSTTYKFFSRYGGWISLSVLLIGTIVWAYGPLLV